MSSKHCKYRLFAAMNDRSQIELVTGDFIPDKKKGENEMRYFRNNILVIAIAALVVGVSVFSAEAQSTKTKVKPLATPLPTLSGAEIISRASEDYIEPSAAEKAAEKPAEKKAPTTTAAKITDLTDRIKKLESGPTYDEKQKRLLLNLDILTRAEQRSESLRKQLFEMIEKENVLRSRLEQIELDIRPEAIERTLQMMGSMKPEEVRDARRKSLAAERANVQALMTQVQATRNAIDLSLQKADQMVEKLRQKLEKDIDNALKDDDDPDK